MKKMLALPVLLLLFATLTACGENQVDRNATEPDTTKESSKTNEYYFDENALVTEDVRIEIIDWRVIAKGDSGNEYGSKPVLAIWYNTTNRTGNNSVTPISAWIAMFEATQDNNPDYINTLDMGPIPDLQFLETQDVTIKKDGIVKNAICYELDDTVTPVMLTATRGVGGEYLGEMEFEIKQYNVEMSVETSFDSITYMQYVAECHKKIMESSVRLSNMALWELNYWKSLNQMNGSIEFDKMKNRAYEWLEENSNITQEDLTSEYDDICRIYDKIKSIDLTGADNFSIELGESIRGLFLAFDNIYCDTTEPSGNIKSFALRQSDNIDCLQSYDDTLQLLLKN